MAYAVLPSRPSFFCARVFICGFELVKSPKSRSAEPRHTERIYPKGGGERSGADRIAQAVPTAVRVHLQIT
jgi:hypothetical protein